MEPYTVGQIELEKTVRTKTWKFGQTEPTGTGIYFKYVPTGRFIGGTNRPTVRTKEDTPTDNVVSAEPYTDNVVSAEPYFDLQ
eukprot:scaffold421316_cov65-Attheya_sp.AAC.3